MAEVREMSYGLGTLLRVFGLSRSTLRYYEKLGIVHPQVDDTTSRRTYSEADIYAIVGCNVLRTAGYPLQAAKSALKEDGEESILIRCLEHNAVALRWHEAVDEALRHQAAMASDEELRIPHLTWADEYLLFGDNSENGYDNFGPEGSYAALNALLRSVPVASFGIVEDDHFNDARQPPYRGMAIPRRLTSLVEDLDMSTLEEQPFELGGCACVGFVRTLSLAAIHDRGYREELSRTTFSLIMWFADKNGLEIAGQPFSIGAVPLSDSFCVETFVPVTATSGRGRRMLARLKQDETRHHG